MRMPDRIFRNRERMGSDQYVKWEPLSYIESRLYGEALYDDGEGFKIVLQGESADSHLLKIIFASPLAYRNNGTIGEYNSSGPLRRIERSGESSLYTVENSSWVEWFHEASFGIYRDRKIVHYAIITLNGRIDVLSDVAPAVGREENKRAELSLEFLWRPLIELGDR